MDLLGKNISRLRRERDMTQQELGVLLGVSKGTISNYENGNCNPNIQNLTLLVNIFEVSISDMFRIRESDMMIDDNILINGVENVYTAYTDENGDVVLVLRCGDVIRIDELSDKIVRFGQDVKSIVEITTIPINKDNVVACIGSNHAKVYKYKLNSGIHNFIDELGGVYALKDLHLVKVIGVCKKIDITNCIN